MPRHRASERESITSETRRRLLEASVAEFAREGYNGANINRISTAAGFAKGTVYNYFPSKRALMLELIDTIAAGHYEFVGGQVLQEHSPPGRLQRFFRAGAEWITGNLPRGRVMLAVLNGPDETFKARMQLGNQPMHELLIGEVLAPGIESGAFRKVDPRATAGLLMTLYLGLGSTVDETGRTRLSPEWVAEFVLDGLRAPAW